MSTKLTGTDCREQTSLALKGLVALGTNVGDGVPMT